MPLSFRSSSRAPRRLGGSRHILGLATFTTMFHVFFCVAGMDDRDLNGFLQWLKDGAGHLSSHVAISDFGDMGYGIKSVASLEARNSVPNCIVWRIHFNISVTTNNDIFNFIN